MITRDNYEDCLKLIDAETIKRMLRFQYVKEYAWLELHTFNVGSYITVKCTDKYKEFQDGDVCMYLSEVVDDMRILGLIEMED